MPFNYLNQNFVIEDKRLMTYFLNELLGVRYTIAADPSIKAELMQDLTENFEDRYNEVLSALQRISNTSYSSDRIYTLMGAEKNTPGLLNDFNGEHNQLTQWISPIKGYSPDKPLEQKKEVVQALGKNLGSFFALFRYVLSKPMCIDLLKYPSFKDAYLYQLRNFAYLCKMMGCNMNLLKKYFEHEIGELDVRSDSEFQQFSQNNQSNLKKARVEQITWLRNCVDLINQ